MARVIALLPSYDNRIMTGSHEKELEFPRLSCNGDTVHVHGNKVCNFMAQKGSCGMHG
jgi:hypothetical protein